MNVASLKIHHLGAAVKSIETAAAVYRENGYRVSEKIFDPLQNVNICFAEKSGEPAVELVEPAGENSPVFNLVKKTDDVPEVYHICYAVENIEKSISELRRERWLLVKPPQIAVACGNAKVAFLYSKEAGLVELLEAAREAKS